MDAVRCDHHERCRDSADRRAGYRGVGSREAPRSRLPRLELESELILALVVPPLIYSAARGAGVSGLGANLRPILTLGVALVVLTTAALGIISFWLLPSLGLATAFVLGAELSPVRRRLPN